MRTFSVWEPAIESSDKATKVEADTHGQAAFLCAAERKIGHRGATYGVVDNTESRMVTLEPRTWYAVVGVSEPLWTVTTENDSPPSTDAS